MVADKGIGCHLLQRQPTCNQVLLLHVLGTKSSSQTFQNACRSFHQRHPCGIRRHGIIFISPSGVQSSKCGSFARKWTWDKKNTFGRPIESLLKVIFKIVRSCFFLYFPWWAIGPYSPGLGPCCYPPLVGKLFLE